MSKKTISLCPVIILILFHNFLISQNSKPNIIMIVVDDMRYDEWGGGGHTFLETPNIDRLAAEGTVFRRAYHAIPLCSPNRASILTGQYPSRHGIIDNTSRNQASYMLDLFPQHLQNSGYKTAHIGKWHMGNSALPRPGYDYWLCIEGQGRTYDPILYEGEKRYEMEGYITDIFTEKAVEFIKKNSGGPFFLYIGHKAIHPEAVQRDDGSIDLSVPKEFIPAKRHQGKYDNRIFKRSPSYSPTANADDGKPVIQQAFKIREELMHSDPEWINAMDLGVSEKTIRNRAEMMIAVDESLREITSTLDALGIAENTVVIFTSDNGYFFGEHGFSLERRMPYEESIKAPLFISHPAIGDQVPEQHGLVVSIDLSATVLDIAGIRQPTSIQGKSLVPLLTGDKTDIRSSALIEYYSNENPFPWTAQLDYRVVVTDRYKYIKWLRFDSEELYDLTEDPYEQNNLIHNTDYYDTSMKLRSALRNLQILALGLD